MANIFFFPPDLPVSQSRKEWFGSFGFELKPWQGSKSVIGADALLLATPIKCSNMEFVHPEGVWRHFLTEINPEARLILTGLLENQTTIHYMHWFYLPEDFKIFYKKLKPVKNINFFPSPGFTTIETLWKRFWDGHNKDGFFYYFSKAKMISQAAYENILEDENNWAAEKEFLLETGFSKYLKVCQQQWIHYSPYWEALPFTEQISQLHHKINRLEKDINKQEDPTHFLAVLNDIHVHITNVDNLFQEICRYIKT